MKKTLFLLILAFLFVPFFQNKFKLFEEIKLNGSFNLAQKPTNQKWINGDYQKTFDTYYNDHLGFRNFFVRLNNQIQYSVFFKGSGKDVEVGKKGYLYEGGYIRDYMGYNFVGNEKITTKAKEIKIIQEALKHEGVNLIVGFAPGKASYFPEYFPLKYDSSIRTTSNFQAYIKAYEELNVDYIDFNTYFVEYKKKSQHPIFPKGGIHWGELGVALALDSLSKHIEFKRKINMPDFYISQIEYPEKLDIPDRDISDGMNLLFEYPYYKMPKPSFKFIDSKNTIKPKLLIIGDSFGYGILNSPLLKYLFSSTEYWYYNREIHPRRKEHSNKVEDVDVKNEFKKYDVVLLLSSEVSLYKFDYGFSDSYYRANL